MAAHSQKRPHKRRRALTILAVVLALAACAGIALFVIDRVEKANAPRTPYLADVYKSDPNRFALYDPDAPSIFTDEEYLSLDRSLHVKRGGEEFTVTQNGADKADAISLFFLGYFDALAHGDAERYNSLFTDGYFETYDRQADFSEQRVYDVHVTLLGATDDESRVSYMVEYKIKRNNGTFRRDVYSDSSRPLIFDLVKSGDTYLIDNMKYPNA